MSSHEAQRDGNPDSGHHVSPVGSLHLADAMGPSIISHSVSCDSQSTPHDSRPTSHDRNELIERIKRVKSPLWQFRQDVSGLSALECVI